MDIRARTNPFPGLRPFMQEEADLFFGRDRQSDELVRRLASSRFLAVVGTSGSGKSSLVRAGLLPSLESGFMAGAGAHWRMTILRPQDDPMRFLVRAIVETGVLAHLDLAQPAAEGVVETTLRRSSLGLVEAARLARLAPHENLLILVDQFEELFRFADLARQRGAGDEAPAFVKLLLAAAQQTEVPLYVVITMRSDFLGDCARFRGLPEAISDSQYLIPRLTRDELQAVITGPIGVRGGRIAPSLVQRLLNDVGDDMDQLPVLQHALMRAWDHWKRNNPDARPIELSDLETIGGMAEALSQHADEAYGSLTTDWDRNIAERVFKCLTERGPDNREIRRPTQLSRIAAIANANPAEVIRIIDVFRTPGRSFLMPPHCIALEDESVIDISHESLIRQWGRLRTWVEEEAESRATYLRLVEAARLQQAGKGGLWGEPDITYAEQWQKRETPNATWAERYAGDFKDASEYLLASRQREAQRREEEERRRQAELVAAREKHAAAEALAAAQSQATKRAQADATRMKWIGLVIFLLLLVAVYFLYDSLKARTSAVSAQKDAEDASKVAQKERAEAIWHRQTATSERMLDGRIPGGNLRATLQSVAALRFRSDNDSQSAVLASLAFSPHTRQIIDLSSMKPTPALAYSPDGMRIAVGGEDGSVLLLDAKTGKAVSPQLTGLPGAVWSLSFSGDSTRLIIGMADSENPDSTEQKHKADGALRVWDLAQPKPVMLLKGHSGSVYSVAYSKKSDIAASAGSDNTLRVWDAVRGDELWHKTCADKSSCDNYVIAVAISPDGAVVASGGGDAIVRLWDAKTGEELGSLKGHSALVQFVEFSPDGKRIGSASDDSTARVWDIKTRKQIKAAEDHKGSVWSLSFSPDGAMLATASTDGKVRLFSIDDNKKPKAVLMTDGELKGHLDPVYAVGFSKDGDSLISTGQDGTLRRWGPKSDGASTAQIMSEKAMTSVAVSPDGNLIASASTDGTLQTWDTPSLDEPSTVREPRKSISGAHRGEVHTLSFNTDGTQLLSGGADNMVRFWSAATGQSVGPALRGHTAAVRAVAWGADNQVISAAADGVIRVWNATSRKIVTEIPPPKDLPYKYEVWSIAADPKGRYIAAGGNDGLLRLWNTRDGGEFQTPLVGHTSTIFAVAVSRDGTLIATGGADGAVLFWKTTSSKDSFKFHARSRELSTKHIYGITFSADGKLVASSGEDKLLHLWNPEDGTRVGIPLVGHTDIVRSIAFSSLGDFIVSAGDQKLLLWLGPQNWAKALCGRLTQNMSKKQWREWVSPDSRTYLMQCPDLPIPPDVPEKSPTTATTGEAK